MSVDRLDNTVEMTVQELPFMEVGEPTHVHPRSLRRPSLFPFLLPLVMALILSNYLYYSQVTVLGVLTTIMWSLPIGSTVVGLYGVVKTRQRIKKAEHDRDLQGRAEMLIVQVPTVGRLDTFPGLRRAVWSFAKSLPPYFTNCRIDIVVEQHRCPAEALIINLAAQINSQYHNLVRVVEVPAKYQTRKRTRFKARANQFMVELRRTEGETGGDVWILHMDDDTGVWYDSAMAVATFIRDNPYDNPDALHLGQGVLSYPRQNATNELMWLADSVRPGDDLARFAACTGSGTPIAGAHGELLLVRSSIEDEIGFDFGPMANVEDAQFALYFSALYPGRSGWFAGRCYGATPDSPEDLTTQRERWAAGLLRLAFNRTIKLRHRLFLGYCMAGWVLGVFQHITTLLLAGYLAGNVNTSPLHRSVLLLWGCNVAFTIWTYWEGLNVNSHASGWNRPLWRHRVLLFAMLPYFSMLEAIGGIKGLIKVASGVIDFKVIAKRA